MPGEHQQPVKAQNMVMSPPCYLIASTISMARCPVASDVL
jgi:hypothetical protein